MAIKLVGLLGFMALVGSCAAGASNFAFSPLSKTLADLLSQFGYSSHTPVLHQQPFSLPPAAPLFAKTFPASSAVLAPPVIKAYSAQPAFLKSSPFLAAPVTAPVAAPLAAPVAAPFVSKTVLAPVTSVPVVKDLHFGPLPHYNFAYGVHDSLTGDIKSRIEAHDDGKVIGSYSVVDADGYKRTVTYTADDVNGFNAVVHREPIGVKVAAVATAPVVPAAPVVAATPVLSASPVVHHFPLQHPYQYHTSPVTIQQPQQPQTAEVVSEQVQPAAPGKPDTVPAPVPVPAPAPASAPVTEEHPESQEEPQQIQPISETVTQQPAQLASDQEDDSEVVEAPRTALGNNSSETPEESRKEKFTSTAEESGNHVEAASQSSSTTATPTSATEAQKDIKEDMKASS